VRAISRKSVTEPFREASRIRMIRWYVMPGV
jgi:hypothetical protein